MKYINSQILYTVNGFRGVNRIKSSDHLRQSYGSLPLSVSTDKDSYSTVITVDDPEQLNKKVKKKNKKRKNVKVQSH